MKKENTNLTTNFSNKFKLFFDNNFSICKKIIFWSFTFLTVYLFICLLTPINANHSQSWFSQQTAFYSVKYGSLFESYQVSLTLASIAFILMLLALIIFSSLTIIFNKHKLKQEVENVKTNKLNLYKQLFINLPLSILFVLFTIFAFLIPNFRSAAIFYDTQNILSTISDSNEAIYRSSLINAYGLLNITEINNTPIESLSNGILYSNLKLLVANRSKFNFLFYATFSGGIVGFSKGIYAIIVLFAVLLGISLISKSVFYLISLNLKINNLFNKEKISLMKEKINEKLEKKKQINIAKKELSARETQLLKDLSEVNLDKVDKEKKLGMISQEELEEKIAKNNDIKKQLDELIKQKSDIEKQKIENSRLRKAFYNSQNKNSNKSKSQKQTITIPDKELDEIFRNLEID